MRRNTTVVSNASLSTSKFRVSLNSAGKVPSDMINIFWEVPIKQKKIYLGHGCPIWHRSSSSSAPFHWPNPPGGFSRKDLKSIQQNLSPTTSGTEKVDLLNTWIPTFFVNFRRFTTLNCYRETRVWTYGIPLFSPRPLLHILGWLPWWRWMTAAEPWVDM